MYTTFFVVEEKFKKLRFVAVNQFFSRQNLLTIYPKITITREQAQKVSKPQTLNPQTTKDQVPKDTRQGSVSNQQQQFCMRMTNRENGPL